MHMAKKHSVDDEDKDLEDDEDTDEGGADKEDLDDGADDGPEEDDEEDGKDPPARNNLSHIIARKNRKIEKLEKKKEEKEEDDDEDDEDEDDRVARRAGNVVRKIIEPLAGNLDRKQTDIDISTFLADPRNAKFRKYEAKARRWAAHPSRAQVPIASIFKEIAFDDFAAGAEEDADQKRDNARRNSARGSSFRQAPKSELDTIRNLKRGTKEFENIRARVGAGETIDLSEEE